jgi:hypothetical protein
MACQPSLIIAALTVFCQVVLHDTGLDTTGKL